MRHSSSLLSGKQAVSGRSACFCHVMKDAPRMAPLSLLCFGSIHVDLRTIKDETIPAPTSCRNLTGSSVVRYLDDVMQYKRLTRDELHEKFTK